MSKIVVNTDEAIEIYLEIKDDDRDDLQLVFDKEKLEFVLIDFKIDDDKYVRFLDCFAVANKVIDTYLDQDGMENHKKSFKSFKKTGNRIIDILWYFESIDGAYSFEEFECLYVSELIKAWCDKNGFFCTKLDKMK